VLRIVHPTTYDFGGLAGVPGTQMSVVIAQRIDATEFESATLQLRMHGVNIADQADLITVSLAPDGFTNDDTNSDFTRSTALVPVASFSITAFTSASDFQIADVTGLSSLYLVYVTGMRNAITQTALSARISLDLVLKTGEGSEWGHLPHLVVS
jgi:hypothetical protein